MAAVPVLRPFTALRPLPQLASPGRRPALRRRRRGAGTGGHAGGSGQLPAGDPAGRRPVARGGPGSRGGAEHGREALHELVRRGVLVREEAPALWIYRQQVPRGPQARASRRGSWAWPRVADYDGRRDQGARAHPARQGGGAGRHVDVLDAHDEPVFLFHRGSARPRRGGRRGDRTRARPRGHHPGRGLAHPVAGARTPTPRAGAPAAAFADARGALRRRRSPPQRRRRAPARRPRRAPRGRGGRDRRLPRRRLPRGRAHGAALPAARRSTCAA